MFRYNCFSALMHSRGFAMEESVDPLRQALAHSPDNIPLRRHLAAILQSLGRLAEAETEFRELLRRQPDDLPLRISLAMVYYQAEKYSQSMVIVEDLLKRSDTPAAVMVIHARLLARAGEVERAVRQYRDAVRQEPEAADTEFADSLGIGAEEDEELSDGQLRWNDDPEGPSFPMEKPDQTFADVGGMESVKEEIRVKIIMPLTHADAVLVCAVYRFVTRPRRIASAIVLVCAITAEVAAASYTVESIEAGRRLDESADTFNRELEVKRNAPEGSSELAESTKRLKRYHFQHEANLEHYRATDKTRGVCLNIILVAFLALTILSQAAPGRKNPGVRG